MAHTIPPEGLYTEAEKHFIESSPDGLWPDNQDSVFGQVRKCFTDILQEQIDEITILNEEIFVPTSLNYLSLREEEYGLTVAPSGASDATRRARILGRVRHGLFTRTRVRQVIEDFITATFGEAVSFTTGGVSLSAAGVQLFSGVNSLTGTYNIVENIPNFSYAVYIRSDIGIDLNALTRELTRITPAHISFTIQFIDDPLWPTNYVTNPGFETNTTGWSTFGTNTIARSTTRSKYGGASLLVTYQNDLRLASTSVSVPDKNRMYTAFAWVYIPANWDGGQITIGDDGIFSGAAYQTGVNANMLLRDQWQRVFYTYTIGDDVDGAIFIRAASAPTAGRQIYIDGVYMSPQAPNLAQNPGVELVSPFSPPWNPNFGTTTRDTTVFHSGVASAKQVTVGLVGEGLYFFNPANPGRIQVVPGKTYRAQCWINLPVGKQVAMAVYFLDTNNVFVNSGLSAIVNGTGGWQWAGLDVVPPSGSDAAVVDWYTTSNQGVFSYYVDDFVFSEAPISPTTPT